MFGEFKTTRSGLLHTGESPNQKMVDQVSSKTIKMLKTWHVPTTSTILMELEHMLECELQLTTLVIVRWALTRIRSVSSHVGNEHTG